MLLISVCTLLIWLILLYSNQVKCVENGVTLGFKNEWRYSMSRTLFTAFVVVLILTSTVRHGFIDTYAYKIMYELSRDNLKYVYSEPWGVENGWLLLMYFLNFITKNPIMILFLTALLVNLAYSRISLIYSADVPFSLFIYFSLYFMDTNNGMRQFFAAALIILAYPLLMKKKYLWYAIIVLLASRLHKSAIFALLIAFVAIGKPFNKKVQLALIAGVMFLLFPELGNTLLGDMFADSKYLSYLEIEEGFGMSFLRALITGIVPGVLAIIYLRRLNKAGMPCDKGVAVLFNVIIVNMCFTIMGLYMQYWGRFTFYTSYACVAMMPKLIYEVLGKNKKQYKISKTLCIVAYAFFFIYNIYVNTQYGSIKDFYIDFDMILKGW